MTKIRKVHKIKSDCNNLKKILKNDTQIIKDLSKRLKKSKQSILYIKKEIKKHCK